LPAIYSPAAAANEPGKLKEKLMPHMTLSLLAVRRRPGAHNRGVLIAGRLAIPVVLGRAGIRANKREGDGATPRGLFRLRRLWWRADRGRKPLTLLPTIPINRDVAWCEDATDRRYNRPFRRLADEPGDRLWRDDRLYDYIVEIDHNTRPRIAGRGSAIFLHVARPNRSPTAGCIAFAAPDLRRLLARLGPDTRILIQV
jgi:L,D-peptidoglycan transpeptidase YkuD (ErfK/YbiS/YcfS/YnhG family)